MAREHGRSLTVGLRPEDIRVGRGDAAAQVELVEHLGSAQIVHLSIGGGRLLAQISEETELRAGMQTTITIEPQNFYCFDPQSERALHAPGMRL
jgi:ABC-type sugar transport system ATPase subunit